ncbi:MAG: hypothetical protein M3Y45_07210, partial [Actinomycetota bacterium]|nr:hypothetical protein [Actinomycetota bacterium]
FTLMSYGGAGPFHAVGYARSLGIDTIVVPGEAASVWSAFGISQADIRYQLEASTVFLEPFDGSEIEKQYDALEQEALEMLGERADATDFEFRRFARVRFQWQLHELEIPIPDGHLTEETMKEISADFVKTYSERYGEVALLPGARLEIVTLRLEPAKTMGSEKLDRLSDGENSYERGTRPVWFERGAGPVDAKVYDGNSVPPGVVLEGPAVVDMPITGIVMPAGTTCERIETGDFVLKLSQEEEG